MSDGLERLVSRIDAVDRAGHPCMVTVTGGVAVGKSTFVRRLRGALADPCAVVATDCFLWPNAVLERDGLAMRKGFPETYDVASLRRAAAELSQGRGVALPVYSHRTYDIDPTETRRIEAAPVVVFEGLHLTTFLGDVADVAVHLEADEGDNERWYLERFEALVGSAGEDPQSFYQVFLGFDPDVRRELARDLWRTINLMNLHDHIAPARGLADVVVTLDGHHHVAAIEELTARGR